MKMSSILVCLCAIMLLACESPSSTDETTVITENGSALTTSVRASSETTESTGIVGWEVSVGGFPGEPTTAVGIDSANNVKIKLAVSVIPVEEKEVPEVTIDLESDHGQWQILDGQIQGSSPNLDTWTMDALNLAAKDLQAYQSALEGTEQVGACFWCAVAGLTCISVTAGCIASGCSGILGCGACVTGIVASCGASIVCCYECVKGITDGHCG